MKDNLQDNHQSAREQATLSVEEQRRIAGLMFEYLKNIIYDPANAHLDTADLPEIFQDLGAGLLYFGHSLNEARAYANDIAKGNLDLKTLPADNELGSELKNLHSTLKHLTWQMGQVAKGDYKQRVRFAGDFSDSINNMIRQLDERDTALHAEIAINQQKTEELFQSVSLFEEVAKNIDQWIIVVDRETKEWLYTNHETENMLHSMISENDLKNWLEEQVDFAERTEAQRSLEFGLHNGEIEQYFAVARRPITWRERRAFAFTLTDITEERHAREELENIAFYDALTGSYSRLFGMNLLERWVNDQAHFVICFVDMDNLKYVNDTYGHIEGDTYILTVTKQLKNFDKNALLCRLGGDEFMLLCKGLSKDYADERLEAMRAELIAKSGSEYQRSISYGVVEVHKDNDRLGSYLLSLADELMYNYKRARKMERRGDA